jgi:hypothetical protein
MRTGPVISMSEVMESLTDYPKVGPTEKLPTRVSVPGPKFPAPGFAVPKG